MKLLITPSILPHRNELNFGECGPFLNWGVAETPQKRTFPKEWSAPLDWEGKVRVIRELAQRAAQKNQKLKVAVQKLVDQGELGGHHATDAQGIDGLENREVDDKLVDEMLVRGEIDLDDFEEDHDNLNDPEA